MAKAPNIIAVLKGERTLRQHIDAIWEWTGPHSKMEWLGMEDTLRHILDQVSKGKIKDGDALVLIDETIAAYTGRGNVLGRR